MPAQPDPIGEFVELFERALEKESADATACALATADSSARPSVRMVLLKKVDEQGFVFYTNYGSRKAEELEANPAAALCFHWPTLKVQVRVEGTTHRVSESESDDYFASRSRMSRIGAWASKQSQPLDSRASLLRRAAKYETKFALTSVPRPPFWGGYRLMPDRIEFWFDKAHRLHERREFTRDESGWGMRQLYP